MMPVLRVYRPAECDSAGVPLDWERCRACDGTGRYRNPRYWGTMPGSTACGMCAGYGSLKAAALDRAAYHAASKLISPHVQTIQDWREKREPIRCDDCGHPMSDGTWWYGAGLDPVWPLGQAYDLLREGVEPLVFDEHKAGHAAGGACHYSPCDEGCRHGGPGRYDAGGGWREWVREGPLLPQFMQGIVEASWRAVDVRCLSWPHDLWPTELAVLCLRCLAER